MKQFGVYFLLISLCSCQYFDTQRISSDQVFEEEVKLVDWNEVDTYPAFKECETVTEKMAQQECFQKTISSAIQQVLDREGIDTYHQVEDTIKLFIEIDHEGLISVANMVVDSLTLKKIPALKSVILKGIQEMDPPAPAYKRGIPVKVKCILPFIVDTQEL